MFDGIWAWIALVSNIQPKILWDEGSTQLPHASSFHNNRSFFNGKDVVRISAHSLASSASRVVRATEILAWSNLEPKKSMIEANSVEHSVKLPSTLKLYSCQSGKWPEMWTDFALKLAHLPSILSSTTIGQLRNRLPSAFFHHHSVNLSEYSTKGIVFETHETALFESLISELFGQIDVEEKMKSQ